MMVSEHDFMRQEFDWLACDRRGYVGFMSSGGFGPLPRQVLANAETLGGLYEKLLDLPLSSALAWQESTARNVADWVEMARRGFYAFDWRLDRQMYCVVAAPASPRVAASVWERLGLTDARIQLDLDFNPLSAFDGSVPVLARAT